MIQNWLITLTTTYITSILATFLPYSLFKWIENLFIASELKLTIVK